MLRNSTGRYGEKVGSGDDNDDGFLPFKRKLLFFCTIFFSLFVSISSRCSLHVREILFPYLIP